MKNRLRNNSLFIFFTSVYFIASLLAIHTFDRQYYQPAKRALIEKDWQAVLPSIEASKLKDTIQSYFLNPAPAQRAEILRIMEEMVSGNEPVVSVTFRKRGELEPTWRSERANPKAFNTRANSLLLRDFKSNVAININDLGKEPVAGKAPILGDLVFVYTSPLNYPPVIELTKHYWLYLDSIILTLMAGYFLMLFFLILPIKRVAGAIQLSEDNKPCFIRKPHTQIERLYNSMARDAALMAITSGARSSNDRGLRLTLSDLFTYLAPRAQEWFGYSDFAMIDLNIEPNDRVLPIGQLPPGTLYDRIYDTLNPTIVRNLRSCWASKIPQLLEVKAAPNRLLFLGILPSVEAENQMRLLVVVQGGKARTDESNWSRSTAERLYRQVYELVERQIGQSRELFREKSEANINLSRNLGHDLTNIIATNKLELMTVGAILRGNPNMRLDSEQKVRIMNDSLTHLLDNTRSLQQIVNLYRAYEYLKSPRYENTNLNRIIEEIISIFRLSMSAPVEITCQFEEQLPMLSLEPRLLKLAFFNLLANAQDSIRRLPTEDQANGRISVHTAFDSDKDKVTVFVMDSGPGIRTHSGELATRDEIKQIFDLGYSTKPNGDGEGLGLNWVRTILTEFHKGELTAYNSPQGGAVFEFSFDMKGNAVQL